MFCSNISRVQSDNSITQFNVMPLKEGYFGILSHYNNIGLVMKYNIKIYVDS
jgi:hypothetical protein